MPANFILGKDGVVYISNTVLTNTNSGSTLNSATQFNNVQDVTLNLEKDLIEISSRENAAGFKQKATGLKDATVTTKILWKPADTVFNTVRNAYLNDLEISAWMLSGLRNVTGVEGPAGNWLVRNFSRSEPLNEAMTADVELVPSSFTHWYQAP
jgi:predicted secreted protein